mmetsp:Transcript_17432/g.36532  ORF Transcript_17432/g.36532 Transcript_17432/m.36532 type:complete len:217 (+) Transcript_17432:136-786(+)
MGFPHLHRRSMFKKGARRERKTSKQTDQWIDDSCTTVNSSSHSNGGRILSSVPLASSSLEEKSSESAPPAKPSSLEVISSHVPRDTEQDVLDLLQRRRISQGSRGSSSSRESVSSRVSFIDEELGLTPRHVVTQIHYRPQTTDDEKREQYYSRRDFDIFEQEELYEKIENEIQEIKKLEEQQKVNGQTGPVVVGDEMNIEYLRRQVERRCRVQQDR